jgi:hypothetical protein
MRRQPKRIHLVFDDLEDRSLLSWLTPLQLRHAYGVDSITFSWNGQAVAGTGAGQTIAIVGAYHNPYLANELHAFDATYGLPDPALNQANLAGWRTDSGWAEEEALDVEWAHAVAPGASLLVVEARSEILSDLMNAVNYARQQPGVSVVSMSWGSNEFRTQGGYDGFFTTPAWHNGVTFVTATGDSGAGSGAQWPASSSHVVAVGGTSLYVDAAGNTLAETAWSGSGGGSSRFVLEPSYQRIVQGSGRRTTPDVSMVADPGTGIPVYTISPNTATGYWQIFGGTSLSAQLVGGLVAIANQGRQLHGLSTLDGPSQTLPALYAFAATDFRDVTVGSNGNRASAGYDLATGLGTPRAPSLVTDLSYYNVRTTVRLASARTRPRLVAYKAVGHPSIVTPSRSMTGRPFATAVAESSSFPASPSRAPNRLAVSLSARLSASHALRVDLALGHLARV